MTRKRHWQIFSAPRLLCPRNGRYYLNLARAYEARAIWMPRATRCSMRAREAMLHTSARREKYSTNSARENKRQQQWEAMGISSDPDAKHSKYDNLQEAIAEEEKAEAGGKGTIAPDSKTPDTRKIEFMKGSHRRRRVWGGAGCNLSVNSAGRHLADARGRPQYNRSHRGGATSTAAGVTPRFRSTTSEAEIFKATWYRWRHIDT